MTVMKFGGAVLGDTAGFLRMVQILDGVEGGLVIVSALATTTRDLESAARTAAGGDIGSARAGVERIRDTHAGLAAGVVSSSSHRQLVLERLNGAVADLHRLLEGVAITRQLTPRTLDRILAFGERFALDIAHYALLDKGLDAVVADATELLVTTDLFGQATPIPSKSKIRVDKILSPLLSEHRFVITQGFVGATERGEPTTMGRESSNLSATMLASLLAAERVEVWTNVEGVRSTDPELVDVTFVRPHLSYEQARHAAHHGLKLLYKTMIDPAETAGIPISIRCTLAPDGVRTEIDAAEAPVEPIVTFVEHAPGDQATVTILFCGTALWLTALAHVVGQINEPEALYVIADPEEEAVTIRTNAEDARRLTALLHDQLTMHTERAQ